MLYKSKRTFFYSKFMFSRCFGCSIDNGPDSALILSKEAHHPRYSSKGGEGAEVALLHPFISWILGCSGDWSDSQNKSMSHQWGCSNLQQPSIATYGAVPQEYTVFNQPLSCSWYQHSAHSMILYWGPCRMAVQGHMFALHWRNYTRAEIWSNIESRKQVMMI